MSTTSDRQKEYYKKYAEEHREQRNADYERWKAENPRKMIGTRLTLDAVEILEKHLAEKAAEENAAVSSLPKVQQAAYARKYTTEDGRPSLNALIVRLLSDEVGKDLTPLKDRKTRGRKKKEES